MVKSNVLEFQGRDARAEPLSEMPRAGVQQLVCQTVEAESQELMVRYSEYCTADSKAEVVRNGFLSE